MPLLATIPSQVFGLFLLFAAAGAAVVLLYVWMIVHEVLHPPRGGLAFALARGLPSDPGELSLPNRSFEVSLAAGKTSTGRPPTMPVWEVSRNAASIDDTAVTAARLHVVLLHGWGRSRIDSLSRIEPFLFEDASVYLPDLRGHGDSRTPTTLGDREVDDIDRLIASLAPGPVVLAGHSMGATVAIRCATDGTERERVVGVIAIAPYDTIATPISERLATRDLPRGPILRMALRLLRWRGVSFTDTTECAQRLRVPLLVLQGERDRISPGATARAIADAGRGEYIELADVEHANHHARHPERFETAIRSFLRRVALVEGDSPQSFGGRRA